MAYASQSFEADEISVHEGSDPGVIVRLSREFYPHLSIHLTPTEAHSLHEQLGRILAATELVEAVPA